MKGLGKDPMRGCDLRKCCKRCDVWIEDQRGFARNFEDFD